MQSIYKKYKFKRLKMERFRKYPITFNSLYVKSLDQAGWKYE